MCWCNMKNKILNSLEIYNIIRVSEDKSCKSFIKWFFTIRFKDRIEFLELLSKENLCSEKDVVDYITKEIIPII